MVTVENRHFASHKGLAHIFCISLLLKCFFCLFTNFQCSLGNQNRAEGCMWPLACLHSPNLPSILLGLNGQLMIDTVQRIAPKPRQTIHGFLNEDGPYQNTISPRYLSAGNSPISSAAIIFSN